MANENYDLGHGNEKSISNRANIMINIARSQSQGFARGIDIKLAPLF